MGTGEKGALYKRIRTTNGSIAPDRFFSRRNGEPVQSRLNARVEGSARLRAGTKPTREGVRASRKKRPGGVTGLRSWGTNVGPGNPAPAFPLSIGPTRAVRRERFGPRGSRLREKSPNAGRHERFDSFQAPPVRRDQHWEEGVGSHPSLDEIPVTLGPIHVDNGDDLPHRLRDVGDEANTRTLLDGEVPQKFLRRRACGGTARDARGVEDRGNRQLGRDRTPIISPVGLTGREQEERCRP